jgi:hypothetical protein
MMVENMSFNKKGQSALEFLTTYGWAFLVALIMIGALAYFGVLNPSKYLPDRCNVGSEVTCEDYVIDSVNRAILIKIKNNAGFPINITNINVTSFGRISMGCDRVSMDFYEGQSYSGINNDISDFVWKPDSSIGIRLDNCNSMDQAGVYRGDKVKVEFNLTYYNLRSSQEYSHTIQGDIYAMVE